MSTAGAIEGRCSFIVGEPSTELITGCHDTRVIGTSEGHRPPEDAASIVREPLPTGEFSFSHKVFKYRCPILANGLIGLGFALKGLKLVPDTFWAPAEKLTFYLFFPALLVANIAGAGTIGVEALPMAAAVIIGVVLVAGTVSALRPRLGLDGPGFTSVFQGSFRPNTYVGIGAAYALYGEAGLALMAIAVVAVVPLVMP